MQIYTLRTSLCRAYRSKEIMESLLTICIPELAFASHRPQLIMILGRAQLATSHLKLAPDTYQPTFPVLRHLAFRG